MSRFLTTAEVAELLHVSVETLRKWRQTEGRGPKWNRWPGTRMVRYDSDEVKRWSDASEKA